MARAGARDTDLDGSAVTSALVAVRKVVPVASEDHDSHQYCGALHRVPDLLRRAKAQVSRPSGS